MFKYSGTTWTFQRDFTAHSGDVRAVLYLSTGQVVSGSNDDTARVWDYTTGTVSKTFSAGDDVRAVAQVSSNLLALGGNKVYVWIWDFTTGAVIRNLSSTDYVRTIQIVTSSIIAVGTTGDKMTILMNWMSGPLNRLNTNSDDVVDTAITSSMLIMSIGDGNKQVKVRDISGLDISIGNDVCSYTFTNNLRSIVALSPVISSIK